MANKLPFDISPATFGFAALALLNMAVAAAAVMGVARAQADAYADGLAGSYRARFASEVDAHAARMATGVVPYAANLPMLPVQAARLAPPGARYELAGEVGGQWRVLAASDEKRLGQAPAAGLAQGAKSAFTADAGEAGVTYTAYHRVPLLPAARRAVATTAPAAKPTATPAAKPTVKPTAKPIAKPTAKPSARPDVSSHTVAYGETLFSISRRYYGTDGMFLAIYNLNRGVIGPDRSNVPVGARLRLPPGAKLPVKAAAPKAPTQAATPSPSPKATPAPTQAAPSARPAPAATPAARPAAVAPRQLALMMVLNGKPPAMGPAEAVNTAAPLAGAAAGVTGACWLLGGWLLAAKRRRRVEEQRVRFLGGMDKRMRPRAAVIDPALLRSPWQVQQAAGVLESPEPGGAFAEVHAFSDTKLGLFVGDATGSAANSVLSRGLAVASWRAKAGAGATPGETFLSLNRLMADHVPQGDHVTGFYAQVDLLSGAIAYAGAAHAGAYLIGADGRVTLLNARGLPLGVGHELFTARMESGVTRLQEGEALWVHTDGLTKAENAAGEPFGMDRLEACLREGAGWAPERLVAHVQDTVRAFVGKKPLKDDAAIACLRLAPQAAPLQAPAAPIER